MEDRQPARGHNQAATRSVRNRRNRAFNFVWLAYADWSQLHSEQRSNGLDCGELTDPVGRGGVPKDDRSRQAGQYLFEQLKRFRADAIFELGKASGVASRSR